MPCMAATMTTEPTHVRLLDAAEKLIGEHGVEGVSLRSINAAAGGNVAAAHYHFGSKQALVRAVLERRMAVLAEERFALLATLEHATSEPTPRAIVEVLALPLVQLASTDDGAAYVRFLAALDRSGGPWLELLDEAFRPQWVRLAPVFARATPALTDAGRNARISIVGATLLHLLADADRFAGALTDDEYRGEVIGVITSILAASPIAEEAP
jgi:AcrR family transcriptional regulator